MALNFFDTNRNRFPSANITQHTNMSAVRRQPVSGSNEPTEEMSDQHRQKSQDELAQEARDEELARQLSMEEEQHIQRTQQQQRAQQPPGARPAPSQLPAPNANGAYQMPCEVCSCINNIYAAKVHLRHLCGGCQRLLPPFDPSALGSWERLQQQEALMAAQVVRQQQQAAQQRQQPPPAAGGQQPLPRPGNSSSLVQCPTCGYGNLIPPGSGGPFLCGTCRNMLPPVSGAAPPPQQVPMQPAAPPAAPPVTAPPPAASVQPPIQTAASAPADPNIVPLQAEVVRQVVSHHVRCGQCPHVNLVQSETMGEVLFRCGGCQAVNKAVFR